jgi:hypothetical protein
MRDRFVRAKTAATLALIAASFEPRELCTGPATAASAAFASEAFADWAASVFKRKFDVGSRPRLLTLFDLAFGPLSHVVQLTSGFFIFWFHDAI